MDVDVLRAVADKRNAFTYYTSLVRCLMKFTPYHVEIKAVTPDGEIFLVKDCIMVGVCNGTDFGGGMHIAPGASISDGKLDLMIAEKLDRGPFGILSKFVKGRHDKLPEVTHYEITEIDVIGDCPIELDGEIYENIPLRCKVVHNGLVTFKNATLNSSVSMKIRVSFRRSRARLAARDKIISSSPRYQKAYTTTPPE
mgnify:CR=1 FL=1